jgi:hypothetical protein
MKVNTQGINLQIDVKHPKPLLNGLKQVALENNCPITVAMMGSDTYWVYGTPKGQANSIWEQVVEITEDGEFKVWIGQETINLGTNPFEDKPLTYEECFLFSYFSLVDYKGAYLHELENPTPGAKYYGFFKREKVAEIYKYKIYQQLAHHLEITDGIWIEEVEILPDEHSGLVWQSCIAGIHFPVVNKPTTFYALVIGTIPTRKKQVDQPEGVKISSFMAVA